MLKAIQEYVQTHRIELAALAAQPDQERPLWLDALIAAGAHALEPSGDGEAFDEAFDEARAEVEQCIRVRHIVSVNGQDVLELEALLIAISQDITIANDVLCAALDGHIWRDGRCMRCGNTEESAP